MNSAFRIPLFSTVCAIALMQGVVGGAQTAQNTPEATASETGDVDPRMTAAESAFAAQDFAKARSTLEALAGDGNALAQARLARLMLQGLGGPLDVPGAVKLLEQAISSGEPQAMLLSAQLQLAGGDGIEKNPAAAAALLNQAARAGNLRAMVLLGQLYQSGQGVAQDLVSAVRLFQRAADRGEAQAAFELSKHLSRGAGVQQDDVKAFEYLLAAGEAGFAEAQLFLGLNYFLGQGLKQDKAKGIDWLTHAAENNNPMAQRLLATSYMQGDGVDENMELAITWMIRAANAGEAGAQSNLGYIYATGRGTDVDMEKAAFWYEKAADQGLLRAMTALASLYERGAGVPLDLRRARLLYLEAAQQGERRAQAQYAHLMVEGKADLPPKNPNTAIIWVSDLAHAGETDAVTWLEGRVAQNDLTAQARLAAVYLHLANDTSDSALHAKGVDLITLAAERGNAFAQAELSQLFSAGDGVEQDYIAAHKWANLAAARGSQDGAKARDLLAKLMTSEQVAQAQKQARDYVAKN